jgi:hypothetical protein
MICRRSTLGQLAMFGLLAFVDPRFARATAPARPRSSGPARGTLLIIGGGSRGTEIEDTAVRLGGKPSRWV